MNSLVWLCIVHTFIIIIIELLLVSVSLKMSVKLLVRVCSQPLCDFEQNHFCDSIVKASLRRLPPKLYIFTLKNIS